MRKLTKTAARKMQAARLTRSGGPKLKPTACPKCKTLCPGYRIAQVHCAQ